MESVRTAFDWRAAQPAEDGPIDFAPMDAVVRGRRAARRLPVLPVVHRHAGLGGGAPGRGRGVDAARDGRVHARS